MSGLDLASDGNTMQAKYSRNATVQHKTARSENAWAASPKSEK